MMEALNAWIANAADWIFGWILFLPRDLALFSVAVLTSAALTFVRKWTTDQKWLHRAVADEERQNLLIREAKKRADKEAVKRHKETITLIKMKSMRFEGKPLLWALIPVALLATWAFSRLAYVPPRVNEPVEVRATIPHAATGQLVHLAPESGVDVADGWIQSVVLDNPAAASGLWDEVSFWLSDRMRAAYNTVTGWFHQPPVTPPPPDHVAVWRIIPRDSQPHVLNVRYLDHTYEMPFFAGRRQYEAPVQVFEDSPLQSLEVVLKPVRLFDFVGDLWFLQPWIVAYLLICIPFVTILRKVGRVA